MLDAGAEGKLEISADLSVDSEDSIAGNIWATGKVINILSGSELSAVGQQGGGEILVGGDWQGGGSLPQSTLVDFQSGALIDVSAKNNGNGGKSVIWSDVTNKQSITRVSGEIYANGGIQTGDGGQIETSGATLFTDGVSGSASASKGQSGLWLFDPTNITISNAGATSITGDSSASSILASSVEAILNSGTSVSITTAAAGAGEGDITLSADIRKTGGSDATLNLKAIDSIIFQRMQTLLQPRVNLI